MGFSREETERFIADITARRQAERRAEVDRLVSSVNQMPVTPTTDAPTEAVKHDAGKLPVHLLPLDALAAVASVMQFGAETYGERNWELGMNWSRLFRAATWHLWRWFAGAGVDKDSGKSHLWHAGCCVLFLIAYELRSAGTDDRPKNMADLDQF